MKIATHHTIGTKPAKMVWCSLPPPVLDWYSQTAEGYGVSNAWLYRDAIDKLRAHIARTPGFVLKPIPEIARFKRTKAQVFFDLDEKRLVWVEKLRDRTGFTPAHTLRVILYWYWWHNRAQDAQGTP